MKFVDGFGVVTPEERRRADLFYESLTGQSARSAPQMPSPAPRPYAPQPYTRPQYARQPYAPQPYARPQYPPSAYARPAGRRPYRRQPYGRQPYEWDEQNVPQAPPPAPAPAPAAPQPYLPTGGRNFVPQSGVFNCAPTPFVVARATFLPERTTAADAAIDAALTAAGLDAAQRAQIARAGLVPIATEFGAPALTELFGRLRWSAADIVRWGRTADGMLVPRLLLHIPGHFRELARRAPDAREAFVLECLGWLLLADMQRRINGATRTNWWIPPPPTWITAVPNPIPAVSTGVQRLLTRYLFINTTMTADQWNRQFSAWGTGLAGRQWQAEVQAPQPGRPFYASLAAIPAHVNTAAPRAAFATSWTQRLADTDAAHAPHAAGATVVTLAGLQNAVQLRDCDNGNRHLPAGALGALPLQGLEMAFNYPRPARIITSLPLMQQLHPVCTALFRAIRELGWNDLLYETEGAACFRGIKHPASARVTEGGVQITVDPFTAPNATTVTRINTLFTAAQRARVIAATRTARNISEHGLGAAIDFNVPENQQDIAARPFGSMDPRIVAIFEAFHFRCGACFNPTDPMHFEYCQAPCAPAPANAGALGPVVTPRMLMPVAATGSVVV